MGNFMKKLRKRQKNNKGFSLVELIIIIAIMAILVGLIGSQVIPYLSKAKTNKDLTTLDTIYTAFQSAITDTQYTDIISAQDYETFKASAAVGNSVEKLTKSFEGFLGFAPTSANIGTRFTSDASKVGANASKLILSYNSTSNLIQVQIGSLMVDNQGGSNSVASPVPTK